MPLEAERDAGKYLYKVIKPYIGIARLPVAQESAKIQGLLIDLRKDENISYVRRSDWRLIWTNSKGEQRRYQPDEPTDTRAANKKESGAVLRERIDGYYEDLVMLAQSYSVAVPSEGGNGICQQPEPADHRNNHRQQPAKEKIRVKRQRG
ncbi:MAG: DUF6261 family protein [Parabacteroides merdae]